VATPLLLPPVIYPVGLLPLDLAAADL